MHSITSPQTANYFEYTEESYDNHFDLHDLKQFNIYSLKLFGAKEDELLFTKKISNDICSSKSTVFKLQGFINEETYSILMNQNCVRISLVYFKDGQRSEKSMYYGIKKQKDKLIFVRGDLKTIKYIIEYNTQVLLFIKFLCTINHKKIKHCTKNNIVSLVGTRDLKHLFSKYRPNVNSKKLRKEYKLLHEKAKAKQKTIIIQNGLVLPLNLSILFRMNCLFSQKSRISETLNIKKLPDSLRVDLSFYDFVEHSFSIEKRTVIITKYKNLKHNLNPNKFKGIYKDFVEKQLYKTLKNIVLFPLLQESQT